MFLLLGGVFLVVLVCVFVFWKDLKGFLRIFLWIGLVFSSGSKEGFGPFEAVCWCECIFGMVWFVVDLSVEGVF